LSFVVSPSQIFSLAQLQRRRPWDAAPAILWDSTGTQPNGGVYNARGDWQTRLNDI
jgi:hypothetical protein